LIAGTILTISSVIYAKAKYPNDPENIYAFPLFAVPMVVLIGSAILFPISSTIGGYQSRKKTNTKNPLKRNPKTPLHLIRRVANSSPTRIYPPVHIRAKKIIQDYDTLQNENP